VLLLLLSVRHCCGLNAPNALLRGERLLHCLLHLTVTAAAAWKVMGVPVAAAAAAAAAAAGCQRLCLPSQQSQHALRA
jgi:hypothetical protein